MLLKDVPVFPAYLVFHDAFMNGAMDVYPCASLIEAQTHAERLNNKLSQNGCDDCGIYSAYEKLPRKRIWKFHQEHTNLLPNVCSTRKES